MIRTIDELRRLKATATLQPETALALALRAAEDVIADRQDSGESARGAVSLLCEISSNPDQAIAQAGASAIFPALVERLNDSFDPAACALYDRTFAQVIDFYRRLPEGKRLDEGLRRFGILTETDILDRKTRISNLKFGIANPAAVLLLSRITLGADIAVTSVIINRLRTRFPNAELVIFGSGKLSELFGGDPRLKVREVGYERGGTVLSRLTSWLEVAAAVEDETKRLDPDQFVLIDPDSRLTQLGLLPLLRTESNYLFFESRSFRRHAASSLGHLTSRWINEVTGDDQQTYPFLALTEKYRKFGSGISDRLRNGPGSRIVAVSFGVGGNPRKRISAQFEERLITALLRDTIVILDKGSNAEERAQVDRIVAKFRSDNRRIIEVDDSNTDELIRAESLTADLMTWDGGIGTFAGLVAAADQYIGYDSAGQHIAAALGVPTLTIFVNSNSPTFAERWQPYGLGIIKVLNIDAAQPPRETNSLLADVLKLLKSDE